MQGMSDRVHFPMIQLLHGSINVAISDHVVINQVKLKGSTKGRPALMVTVSNENVVFSLSHMEMVNMTLQIIVKNTVPVCPFANISNTTFTASIIELYAGCLYSIPNKGLRIKSSTFQITEEQPYVIAICPDPWTRSLIAQAQHVSREDTNEYDVALQVDNVIIYDASDRARHALSRQGFICNSTQLSDQFTPDIYLGNNIYVNLTIANSYFNRHYGSAVHSKCSSYSSFKIYNSLFTGYTQGVLVFSGDLNGVNIILINVTMSRNSISTEGTRAAGLAIIPSKFPRDKDLSIVVKECRFQQNTDHVGNLQIILLHGANEFIINNSAFIGNIGTVINAKESNITFMGEVTFDSNSAWQGGALFLSSSLLTFHDYTTVNFESNHAIQFGGAIFIENCQFYLQNDASTQQLCFYRPSYPHYNFANSRITFSNNSAGEGGECIYGTSIRNYCIVNFQEHQPGPSGYWKYLFQIDWSTSFSTVSSKAMRVCLCDSNGDPQCTNMSNILSVYSRTVYPGERFPIRAAVVGAEFGTTIGEVYAKLLPLNGSSQTSIQDPFLRISTPLCTSLNYSIHSDNSFEIIYLTSSDITLKYYGDTDEISKSIDSYNDSSVIPYSLMSTPVFINVTLSKCPVGFILTNDPSYCECYYELRKLNVTCTFSEGKGYISREGSKWVGVQDSEGEGVIFNDLCPFDRCSLIEVSMNLDANNGSDSDAQCVFYHSGYLCGGCKKGYSVAIGSSHCLNCTTNDNLALMIFFAAAGPLLYIVIAALDLTITRGNINGLIFYANIIWLYQSIVFTDSKDSAIDNQPYQTILYGFRIFIAWLNLDFGIEMCFIKGLDAFWKSLLQYIFPLYIWFIAWLVKTAYNYLSVQYLQEHYPQLAKFAGKPVDVLTTFIFLSYTKLLRTIIAAFAWATLTYYPQNSTKFVWAVDGNITYFNDKHIIVFVFAILSLILTLSYTIYVFFAGLESCLYIICRKNQSDNTETTAARSMQEWCKRILDMPLPLRDSHFLPLRNEHRYWFGLLLLVRIILLVIFSATYLYPQPNLLVLMITATVLICYMGWKRIYNKESVWLLQGLSLSNLIFLSGALLSCKIHWKPIIVCISIFIALIQFLVIVLHRFIQCCFKKDGRRIRQPIASQAVSTTEPLSSNDTGHVNSSREELLDRSGFRESLLLESESEPLISHLSTSSKKNLFRCFGCCKFKEQSPSSNDLNSPTYS
jgi:predicted outer membrane repeat protein